MSPLTPKFQLPYPAPTDPADVPVDMQELALQTEIAFGNRKVYSKAIAGSPQLTSGTYVFWPDATGIPITIPTWANRMIVNTTAFGCWIVSSTAIMDWGFQCALVMGPIVAYELRAATQRVSLHAVSDVDVTGIRGSNENLYMRARRLSGTGAITCDGILFHDVQFA